MHVFLIVNHLNLRQILPQQKWYPISSPLKTHNWTRHIFLKQNTIYVVFYKPSLHLSPGSNHPTHWCHLAPSEVHLQDLVGPGSHMVPPSIPISLSGSRFAGKSGELQTYQIVEAPGASGDGGFVPGNMSPPRDPSSLKLVDNHHFSPFGGWCVNPP